MEELQPFNTAVADDQRQEEEKQRALARVSVGTLSLLLAGLMALIVHSHCEALLWLVSELCAVLCILLYFWAYHLTQNLTAGAAVPVEALVFACPLIFVTGFLAALLAVTVGPVAGVLVMVADLACTSGFFGFCVAEYMRYNKSFAEHNKVRAE